MSWNAFAIVLLKLLTTTLGGWMDIPPATEDTDIRIIATLGGWMDIPPVIGDNGEHGEAGSAQLGGWMDIPPVTGDNGEAGSAQLGGWMDIPPVTGDKTDPTPEPEASALVSRL